MEGLTLEEIVTFAMFGALGLLVIADFLVPARRFPSMRLWRIKGALYFITYLVLSTAAPFYWDGVLSEYQLLDLSGLGTLGGAAVAFLVYELVAYAWHRMLHRFEPLWRIHQTHHAAERLDVWSAFMFHPLGMIAWTFVASITFVWIVGVSPEAALVANGVVFVLATLGHANVKTPRWMGYFISRPEMHAQHHQRGVHAGNYADIALFDILFGTWSNPESFDAEVGLVDGGSERLGDLLLGRDLLETKAPRTSTPDIRPA